MPRKKRPPTLFAVPTLFGLEVRRLDRASDAIRAGDMIEARGGPSYEGEPMTPRGLYRVEAIIVGGGKSHGRTWLDCTKLERLARNSGRSQPSTIACGRFLLYVCGGSYRNPDFPGVTWEPFRIKKVRPRK